MRRRKFIALLGVAASWPRAVQAQVGGVRRLGVLVPWGERDPEGQALIADLQQGLAKRGWAIDRNLQIDYRWGIDSVEKTQVAIAELLALSPDVVMADTSRAMVALLKATQTVPIVFAMIYEPVTQGFVQSLAHPAGNATGFTAMEATIGAKWLELLAAIAPHLTRVAFMVNPNNPGPIQSYRSAETTAPHHGIEVVMMRVQKPAEIEAALATLGRDPFAGVIVPPDGFLANYNASIIEAAARYRLPAIYGLLSFAHDGGLMSYGVNIPEQYRQAAEYVDRILRGEKPGDLPVQQPTKYDLVINLKTAEALGLTVPPTLLASADEVIE